MKYVLEWNYFKRWKLLTLRHHATTFGGFMHCGSGNKTFLICHVILLEYRIKRSFNFMSGRHLKISHPAMFGDYRHCGSGHVFNVKWPQVGHEIKALYDLGWNPLMAGHSTGRNILTIYYFSALVKRGFLSSIIKFV